MRRHSIPEEVQCCSCNKMVDNIEENYYLEGPMHLECHDESWTCPECGHAADFPVEWCECGMSDTMKRHLRTMSQIVIDGEY